MLYFEVGDTNVNLNLFLSERAGPITGATITCAVRRLSDDFFLDWNDNTFKASGWVTKFNTTTDMNTVDTDLAGHYRRAWDSSTAITTESEYQFIYKYTRASVVYQPFDSVYFNEEGLTTATINSIRDSILSDSIAFSGANIDVAISSRQSEASAATRAATNQTEHDATQTDIAALNDISITDVQTALTNQGYTVARAANLDNLDATISSVNSAIAALNNLSITDVQTALTNQGYTTARALLLANLDATISSVNTAVAALNDISIGDVQTAMDSQGYTTARAALLSNLDATISSVLAAIAALSIPTAAVISDIVWEEARGDHKTLTTMGGVMHLLRAVLANNLVIDENNSQLLIYDDNGTSILATFDLTDRNGQPIVLQGTGPVNRTVV